LVLPGGLEMEEYKYSGQDFYSFIKRIQARHPERGHWYLPSDKWSIDGKPFETYDVSGDYVHTKIFVKLDDIEIATIECGKATAYPTVISIWTYGRHWMIQSVCHQEFDVFWDGVSLNESKGYQSSFGFQLMGKKPFYMFKRDGKVWLWYRGQEVLLGYDEIKLTYCCMSYPPPEQFENMIAFYALKEDQLYYVVIGLFGH
jgi:hypothetical protein